MGKLSICSMQSVNFRDWIFALNEMLIIECSPQLLYQHLSNLLSVLLDTVPATLKSLIVLNTLWLTDPVQFKMF